MNNKRSIFKDIVTLGIIVIAIDIIYKSFKKWHESVMDLYENNTLNDNVNTAREKIDSSFKNKRYIKLKTRELED